MSDSFKKGDTVMPRPYYVAEDTIYGKVKRMKVEKNWLYHSFKKAKVKKVNRNGTLDLKTHNGVLLSVSSSMLMKA